MHQSIFLSSKNTLTSFRQNLNGRIKLLGQRKRFIYYFPCQAYCWETKQLSKGEN